MTSRLKPLTALEVSRLAATSFVGGAPSLQCVVSENGTKSWRLFYRLPGSLKRHSMSLGRLPGVSLADARKLANEKLALAADGKDPKAELHARVAARDLAVREAVALYLDWCRSNNAVKTWESKRSAFAVHFLPVFGKRPLVDVSRRALSGIFDGLSTMPATRRQLYLYLNHFLGWCVERDYLSNNPLIGFASPKPIATRERVLSDKELSDLFKQAGVTATIAKLCLLTAQRRGSVEAMRWDQIDSKAKTWTIPGANMKSSKLHVVPLSPRAVALLRSLPKLTGPYVFGVGSAGQKPFAGTSNGFEGLRRELGKPDWRLHDLRRTAVTLAQRQGCSLDAIRALTQHKPSGVIGVYARHAFEDEKRLVVAAICEAIDAILSP
jgi:integrase